MKKRFLTFILAIAAVVSCTFGFSACGGGNPPESSDNGSSSSVGNLDTLSPEMKDELSGFYYTFSSGSCIITGVKDKTVTEIIIPNFVTSIGERAFYNCDSLTSVEIPDSVTSIGEYAFEYCDSLTSVVIGDGVTSIGYSAFKGCSGLTSVDIGDSVTSIGRYAFSRCDSLTSITVSANNAEYKSIDGNLYTKDGKTLLQYAIGKTSDSFTIPDSVTSIGERAFYDCDGLMSVVIGGSVTSIGDDAFYDCDGLTSVVIGGSVTSIGNDAFYGCDRLTSITFEDTSTWYYTKNNNQTGGTEIDLTGPSTNATYFKSTYYIYYWYKK